MPERLRVLVADDDAHARAAIATFLSRRGHVVRQADDGITALAILESEDIDVVLSDVRMPNMDGLALAHLLKQRGDDSVVILMSGYSTIENVVDALREGAYDFLLKPIEPDALAAALERVNERLGLRRQVRALSAGVSAREAVLRLTSLGAAFQPVLEMAQRSATIEMPLLFSGCSRPLADLLAQAIHGLSSRAAWPLLTLDLSLLATSAIESALFGTGPLRSEWGAVRKADRGVLVLHGAECIPTSVLACLAQVAQEHTATIPGTSHDVPVDARIVCTTDRAHGTSACTEMLSRLGAIEVAVPSDAIVSEQSSAPALSAEGRAWLGSVATQVVSEINDPLEQLTTRLGSIFQGFARLAVRSESDPVLQAIASDLGAARTDLERVRDVVLDLRSVAHDDSSHDGHVDLRGVIEQAIELSRSEIERRSRFLKSIGQLPPVPGNGSRYRQAILNLLLRAARSIPEGSPDEHLVEFRAHADGSRVHVLVRDTGEPIPKNVLLRLFDPFDADAGSRASRFGLVVAHTIVTSFGGEIAVESGPDEGTTVRLSLPIVA